MGSWTFLFPDGKVRLKIGGTCYHHGPPIPWRPCPIECQQSDNNHWVSINAGYLLSLVCIYYYEREGTRLCINDISLPYGGLFDIDPTNLWNPPHRSHKVGRDIDIATRVVNEVGQVVGNVNADLLEYIVRFLGGEFRAEGAHYHIVFRR